MKKILFICSLYHPHIGGIETMVLNLSNFICQRGIEPIVLTKRYPTNLASYGLHQSTKIFRVVRPRTEKEFQKVISFIKNHSDQLKPDLIHIIGLRRPLPIIGLILSQYWKIPLVSTIAGSEISNNMLIKDKGVLDEMTVVVNNSDYVTCVSKAIEQEVRKKFPKQNNISTIYAGINIEFIKNTVCVETKSKYVLYLGRLVPEKSVQTLLLAFRDVSNKFCDLKLIIAGEGPEDKNLHLLTKKLRLQNKVIFLGAISQDRAVSLLKMALCMVLPSQSEGGGLVNIEAQAAGCPVIASRIGGIPEYVKENISGLLFSPGNNIELFDKICIILENQGLRKKLIQSGLKYSKGFDWKVLGPKYIALYESLINSSRRGFNPTKQSKIVKNIWK